MGVWAAAVDIERCQLVSPELRRMYLEEVSPLVRAAVLQAGIGDIVDMSREPLELVTSEKLNVLVENETVTYPAMVLVWLCDEAPAPVTGKIHTIRATIDDAATAYEWSHSPLTFTQTLPAGDYSIVGASFVEVDSIAARLMVPAYPWRPAVLAERIGRNNLHDTFRRGRWGEWMKFDFDNPPSVEVLSTAATTGEIYLDLMQTREGR